MTMTMKAARVNAGKTGREIAQKMGVSRATLSLWENGKVAIPADKFEMFCSLCGQTMDGVAIPCVEPKVR